ncbi:MAG TPA: type II toxin-antitoxin system VapC family toxin [Longimicrobium sp.]|nr:type II toxin-antitoxin system VapC family toxin [Longimicrobium sp.]
MKRYSFEPGSKLVTDLFRSAARRPESVRVVVCELVHPEAVSAISQIVHGSQPARYGLSHASGMRAVSEIANDFVRAKMVVVRVGGMMDRAAELVWKHHITGADAVHLAAAIASRGFTADRNEFYFVSSDRRQAAAAAAEGLDVISPG